ncbi:alginate regulatory protein AlgP [Musa troglodytarum]|uniref:Alginate regulatory protein AlgP n=1 Tax=Musa troglodytarum TaxID=320322 RepID=A0A9E7KV96_9LILI|nr:alginate regulatory protein AlgP [Musa troglodytarum]
MATEVLRPHDCLRNRLHVDAFGSRPPTPAKPHRKKPPRSPPTSSSPPSASFHLPPPPSKAVAKPSRANPPLDGRKSPSPRKDGALSEGETRSRRALVMEGVRILKRGEELKPGAPRAADPGLEGDGSVFCSTNRLGPEPEILPRKVGLAVPESPYAGPAFFASPSPSSLPLPSFCLKKGAVKGDEAARRVLAW